MAFHVEHLEGQNPLLLVAMKRNGHVQRLCRAVSRIWDTPELLIQEDARSAIGHLVEHSLLGHKIRPDIVIIDLEDCSGDAKSIFRTIRTISGLRHTPVLALVDVPGADVRDMIYDAGADLVVAWENLETRIGDIAGLAVDNWLNTDPEPAELPQTS